MGFRPSGLQSTARPLKLVLRSPDRHQTRSTSTRFSRVRFGWIESGSSKPFSTVARRCSRRALLSRQLSLSEVDGTSTNIAQAIQVGLASFPVAGARRLVLLSDGNENVAAAADAALIARSLGTPVYALPLGRLPGEPEVRVENLVVPRQVKVGTPYRVEAVVSSTFETPASLELFRDGTFVGRQEVVLQPGKNRYRFVQQTGEEGTQLYQVIVNTPQDTIADNNRWQAFTEVLGPPQILFLFDPPGNSAPLLEALRQQGLVVHAQPWSALTETLSGYREYDALIFDNVPGFGI